LPLHLKIIVAFPFLSIGFTGSRLPKSSVAVDELINLQFPLEMTIADTVRIPESLANAALVMKRTDNTKQKEDIFTLDTGHFFDIRASHTTEG